MPVIGRLDGQVEEVIIKPVGRRQPDGTDRPETASVPPTPPREEPRETDHAERAETTRDVGELPVWLL